MSRKGADSRPALRRREHGREDRGDEYCDEGQHAEEQQEESFATNGNNPESPAASSSNTHISIAEQIKKVGMLKVQLNKLVDLARMSNGRYGEEGGAARLAAESRAMQGESVENSQIHFSA